MPRMAARAQVRSDERRLLGIDRRTAGPALLVLGLAVVMSVVLPSIDSETAYREQLHRGNIVAIADGITLVPGPGWGLASGALVGEARSPVGSTATTEATMAATARGPAAGMLLSWFSLRVWFDIRVGHCRVLGSCVGSAYLRGHP
jgi:hypothetical protein